MDWTEEKALMEQQMRKLARHLEKAKTAARAANDLKIAAETRSHDAKIALKETRFALARCQPDAQRYQWMRLRGLRFHGITAWLYEREADRRVDEAMALEGRGPSQLEREVSRKHPGPRPSDRISVPAAGGSE